MSPGFEVASPLIIVFAGETQEQECLSHCVPSDGGVFCDTNLGYSTGVH